jgi:Domain of unknown function (DUF1707)
MISAQARRGQVRLTAVAFWRVLGWIVASLAQRRMLLVGDVDRERAAVALRERYAGGYLTLDELSRRTGRVVSARSRRDLRVALSGLSDPVDAVAQGRVLVQSAVRGVLLIVSTGAYVAFSLALVLVLMLTVLIRGASAPTVGAFLVVWLVPTYLLSRVWRRRAH